MDGYLCICILVEDLKRFVYYFVDLYISMMVALGG